VSPILSIAAKGLATQSQALEAVARSVASSGLTRPLGGTRAPASPPVRIGALPVGDSIQSIMTLAAVETAYRANAAVMATGAGMLVPVIDLIPVDEK